MSRLFLRLKIEGTWSQCGRNRFSSFFFPFFIPFFIMSAVHDCIRDEDLEGLMSLISEGADLEAVDDYDGRTPLLLAVAVAMAVFVIAFVVGFSSLMATSRCR